MIADEVTDALKRSISRTDPFVTYAEFAREFGFSAEYPPSWANRSTLDAAAASLKNDPAIALDLTFLIRSGTTGYPSVIDGKPYDGTPAHQRRAREVADEIIAKFKLKAKNPY